MTQVSTVHEKWNVIYALRRVWYSLYIFSQNSSLLKIPSTEPSTEFQESPQKDIILNTWSQTEGRTAASWTDLQEQTFVFHIREDAGYIQVKKSFFLQERNFSFKTEN